MTNIIHFINKIVFKRGNLIFFLFMIIEPKANFFKRNHALMITLSCHTIIPFNSKLPVLAKNVFVAAGVCLSGDIIVKEESSFWFNVSCRGDVNYIRIGQKTNIQDKYTKKYSPLSHIPLPFSSINHSSSVLPHASSFSGYQEQSIASSQKESWVISSQKPSISSKC